MNLFPSVDQLIDTENLLSSTTYPVDRNYMCAYCNRIVRHGILDFRKSTYTIYRCECDHALEELEIKRGVISQLEELDRMIIHMDLKRISTALYRNEEKKLREKYKPTA